jgi:hypothetical protein
MKNNTERDEYVFRLWDVEKKSFKEISEIDLPSFLSLKRIRNIIYGGPTKLKSNQEQKIYRIFRLKFLEMKDVGAAIKFTHENQPSHRSHQIQIFKIIKRQIQKRSIINE